MSTSEINDSSRLTGNQPHNHIHDTDEVIVTAFSYTRLIDFHLERRAVDKDGKERPEQSLDNERSIAEDWVAHHGLSPSDLVGEEFGVRFGQCLDDYLSALKDRGLAKQTVSDRKTVVNKLHESFLALLRSNGLPEDFNGALKKLSKIANTSIAYLSRKTGIHYVTLRKWVNGTYIPNPKSLPRVQKLERVLKVSQGTLSSRLPNTYWSKQPRRHCITLWRSHLSKMLRLRYRLLVLTARLREEWVELVLFFTDPEWANERGFNTNSEWRIRWNNNKCVTADIYLSSLRSFFGYLCLPVMAMDKRVAGLGFSQEDLTLALLTDADLVRKYLYFMKGRSVSNSFNNATIGFLSLCTMLTRNETGYLRQRPEFGAKLPRPIAESDWSQWCEDNRLKLKEFWTEITKGKKGKRRKNRKNGEKDRVRKTRDPFEPVYDIIMEREHPISALFDLVDRLESLSPMLERGSKEVLAVHCRSIFQVRLISSNPLRGENFSMMTYIPKDHDSFKQACEQYCRYRAEKRTPDFSDLYVETTGESNLYQKRDGSWRLRFNEEDFKNEKGEDLEQGVVHTPYDVKIVPSVWPALVEYLFRHRPILNEALRNAVQQVRAKREFPALTPEEELTIVRCRYVFRPTAIAAFNIKNREALAGFGSGQMSVGVLSSQILTLTSKYLPESKGFSAHACRHLVATEYIKNEEDGWEVAAAALHNTAATVRKHYAWVLVDDLIKPWSNHHEDIRAKHDRGEL